MNFRIEPRANGDFGDVLTALVRKGWYGMVARLWALWRAGLDAIEANPRAFGLDPDAPPGVEVRVYVLPRYGYLIRYQLTATEVVVISFSTGRQRPGHWHNRIVP